MSEHNTQADLDTRKRFKIVRHYFYNSHKRTIETGLTLEQAQRWCQSEETSSSTCRSSRAKAITRRNGPWFDGYELQG